MNTHYWFILKYFTEKQMCMYQTATCVNSMYVKIKITKTKKAKVFYFSNAKCNTGWVRVEII